MTSMRSFTLVALTLLLGAGAAQAQTADEILDKYFTSMGGKDKLAKLTSVRMTGKVKAQGMEIPLTVVQTAGKQAVIINFQGKEITQQAFDGTTGWSTNFMTQKPEKMEAEASEDLKQETDEFPDAFLDYAKKGFKVALEGKETVEGTECHKIKLTKKPVKVDGKEVENVAYYFFDPQNNVPIMQRTTAKRGQGKGMVIETLLSDYTEVNGLMFPYAITVKMNGQTGQSMVIEKVETNPTLDAKLFAFPEGK